MLARGTSKLRTNSLRDQPRDGGGSACLSPPVTDLRCHRLGAACGDPSGLSSFLGASCWGHVDILELDPNDENVLGQPQVPPGQGT